MTDYWRGENKPMHDAVMSRELPAKAHSSAMHSSAMLKAPPKQTNKQNTTCIMHFAAKRLYSL